MEAFKESIFLSTWKSFKAFKKSGAISLHTKENFIEFVFAGPEDVSISHYGKTKESLVRKSDWNLQLRGFRHYITVSHGNLQYEVISINHTVMVLAATNGDKIFFARAPYWEESLLTARQIIL